MEVTLTISKLDSERRVSILVEMVLMVVVLVVSAIVVVHKLDVMIGNQKKFQLFYEQDQLKRLESEKTIFQELATIHGEVTAIQSNYVLDKDLIQQIQDQIELNKKKDKK